MQEVAASTAASIPSTTASDIRAIAITAQGDGCWLVDEHGQPTGPAILWNDARAASLVEAWRDAGAVDAAFRISGSVAYAGLLSAILPWLERHAPERLERARWALSCNGWLFAQLTGLLAVELSDASNPFSDVNAGVYSQKVLTLFNARHHAGLLPPVAPGAGVTGRLGKQAAAQLGLQAGLPVVMAPYDIVCTAYGAGAARPGEACVILGTTICAEVITTSLDLTGPPVGTTVALGTGRFLRAMPTLTGCEALEWAAHTLGLSGIPALDELAAESEAGIELRGEMPRAAAGVFFLPYLSPAGERSPFLAPEARGSFHGLTLTTTRGDMARSVYDGLCFAIRECLEAAAGDAIHEIRVCGGGAASDYWCQTIADVLAMPVLRSREMQNGARGAHLFALAATGEIRSVDECIARYFAAGELPALNRAALALGATPLVVYPLTGRGERYPFAAPAAEGFMLGEPVSAADRFCATLQGIALIERLSFAALRQIGAETNGLLTISGGATKSEVLNQMRADIMERELRVPKVTEGAFGMAMLAASAGSSLAEMAERMVRIERTIAPRHGFAPFAKQYAALVRELAARGWLPEPLAAFALQEVSA